MAFSKVPGNQKKHGNLGPKASQIYEDIKQEHPEYTKTKAAKIANAVAHHHAGHGPRGKSGK
jgi:hypothetical protein